MPRKKKIDMDKMSQTHGALASPRPVTEVMGYGNPYSTAVYEDYRKQIKAMTDIDLHDHAYKVGVVPVTNRSILEDRLEKQFLTAQSKHIYQAVPTTMSAEAQERQRRFLQGM
jgi:hypothetical protein